MWIIGFVLHAGLARFFNHLGRLGCRCAARSEQWQRHHPSPRSWGICPGSCWGFQDDDGKRDHLAAIMTVKTRSKSLLPPLAQLRLVPDSARLRYSGTAYVGGPIFARRHSRLTCCTNKSLHDDGRHETTGWPLCPSFQRLRSGWHRMEPLRGLHRMWGIAETSNTDQNWHETLVKVGRIVPWASVGLVPSGPFLDTSLPWLVFVDVRNSRA